VLRQRELSSHACSAYQQTLAGPPASPDHPRNSFDIPEVTQIAQGAAQRQTSPAADSERVLGRGEPCARDLPVIGPRVNCGIGGRVFLDGWLTDLRGGKRLSHVYDHDVHLVDGLLQLLRRYAELF